MSHVQPSAVSVESWHGHLEVGVWSLLVAGAVGDVATTTAGLQVGLVEAHPLSSLGLAALGPVYITAAKLLMLGLAYGAWRRWERAGAAGVATLAVYQAGVVAWNLHLIQMAGGPA